MATVNLHPSSTVSNDWTIVGGSGTVHENLADSSDTSLIRTQDQNDAAIVELDDLVILKYRLGCKTLRQ